jgi:hypothetical protein
MKNDTTTNAIAIKENFTTPTNPFLFNKSPSYYY